MNDKCERCSHITDNKDEFCYMFKTAPDKLPCTQHDKFKTERAFNGLLMQTPL